MISALLVLSAVRRLREDSGHTKAHDSRACKRWCLYISRRKQTPETGWKLSLSVTKFTMAVKSLPACAKRDIFDEHIQIRRSTNHWRVEWVLQRIRIDVGFGGLVLPLHVREYLCFNFFSIGQGSSNWWGWRQIRWNVSRKSFVMTGQLGIEKELGC